MQAGSENPKSPLAAPPGDLRPEELPPVTPPSAGFIIQLFLIPALIVAAVVVVWALFGRMAESDTNWQQMVSELGSSNEHRRWRAAHGLAQMLGNERSQPPTDRVPLTREPVIIQGLTDVLKKSLASTTPSEEDLEHQKFLTRTLSMMQDDATVLPVLASAMSSDRDPDVRKSALMSVAAIAGHHFEAASGFEARIAGADGTPKSLSEPLSEPTITDEETWKQIKIAAQDSDPVVRHLAAFTIASVSGPECVGLLKGMLSDGDTYARANAAIGLARNGSLEGIDVLIELLQDANREFDRTASYETPEEERTAFASFQVERSSMTRNCLRAVAGVWSKLSEDQKAKIKAAVQAIEASHFAPDVRTQASSFLREHN